MLGIGDVVGGIATDEHVIGIDALGQIELFLCHLRLKMAYPARSQALLGGLHHHLITHDGRIDFTGIHLVIGANPSVVGNAANEEDERSAKDGPITSKPRLTSSRLLQKLGRIQHHHTGWMVIASRRSNTAIAVENRRFIMVLVLLMLDFCAVILLFIQGYILPQDVRARDSPSRRSRPDNTW